MARTLCWGRRAERHGPGVQGRPEGRLGASRSRWLTHRAAPPCRPGRGCRSIPECQCPRCRPCHRCLCHSRPQHCVSRTCPTGHLAGTKSPTALNPSSGRAGTGQSPDAETGLRMALPPQAPPPGGGAAPPAFLNVGDREGAALLHPPDRQPPQRMWGCWPSTGHRPRTAQGQTVDRKH